jgi:hypothetical protein
MPHLPTVPWRTEMYRNLKNLDVRQFRFIVIVAAFGAFWYLLLHWQPVDAMSPGVLAWWSALWAVSFFNVWVWHCSVAALASRRAETDPAVYRFQRWQLALSGVYVLGCAFRSLLPRADVQRFGLIDSWASSVLVGRSVATAAELCFAAQWALLLYLTAKEAKSRFGMWVSWLLVPLIVFAELCSWYGVLTTSYIGNAIEESTWALAAFLLIVSFAVLRSRCQAAYRPLVNAALVLGAAYFAFMCIVDIPMYTSRWLADEANGREYLSLRQGLWDVGSRWVVTHSWDHWHAEIPWMTLYFSVGVWCSLALVHAPRFEANEAKAPFLEPAAAPAQ